MGNSTIEWTDSVWNPVTGCTKVSKGCANCYAERVFPRAYGNTMVPVDPRIVPDTMDMRPRKFTDVRLHPERLDQPLRWRRPRRIFVNSMSDLFHEDVPFEFIDQVFAVMALCQQHQFQVLTKRPERMQAYMTYENIGRVGYIEGIAKRMLRQRSKTPEKPVLVDKTLRMPLLNAWLGVSCEGQATADERIPLLLKTPAVVRFVSAEPLLAAADLSWYLGLGVCDECGESRALAFWPFKDGVRQCGCGSLAIRESRVLDWIIVGGESGSRARPFVLGWGKDIIRQCKAAGVPVFMKQVGARPVNREGERCFKIKDSKGGDMSEWPEELQVREFPA